MSLIKIRRSISALRHDIRQMRLRAASRFSLVRYALDRLYIASHLFMLVRLRGSRRIEFKTGIRVIYRCDPGDLQSIREVLLQEVYRLPNDRQRKIVVDLGANIGLASTWFAHKYKARRVIALEPDASNCALARLNFEANAVPGTVIEGAIGANEGVARFQTGSASNRGHIGRVGQQVDLLTMDSLFRNCAITGNVNLLKIDIEGSEQDLFTADISWLHRVDELIIEFHPTVVEYAKLISILIGSGFSYTSPSAGALSMDYFKRQSSFSG